jgi:hypothetical protein
MMEEAARIGEAIGIPATLSIEEMFDKARALGSVKTSMLQDAEHGKPVEIDALLTVGSRFRPDRRGADAVHRQRSRSRSSEGNQSRPAR